MEVHRQYKLPKHHYEEDLNSKYSTKRLTTNTISARIHTPQKETIPLSCMSDKEGYG